jgi:methionyl aminopeptidase
MASQITTQSRAVALFKGVRNPYARIPFPACICASINEQVVHGIPSEAIVVKNGDILSLDFGARLDGYCGDAAVTIAIGQISEDKRKLIDVTKHILDIAVARAKPGIKWSRIAAEMQDYAEQESFSIVKDFVGHGIGKKMHEEPRVPNFVSDELRRSDIVLTEGMVLAVEPMVNAGTSDVRTLKDGWVVVTKDGKCSAHFEHTIAIVKNGCEVLTIK